MKQLSLILGFFMCFPFILNAQNNVSTDNDTISLSLDIQEKLLEINHQQQVTSIANVEFGSFRKKAEKILRKKFGNPSIYSSADKLLFTDIKYAGLDFNSLFFLFQSDGERTYLNGCIFVINVNDYQSALSKEKDLTYMLSKKYSTILNDVDSNGNPCHICGVSPLWNVTIDGLFTAGGAIHTNIMKYEEKVAKDAGTGPYAVRLIYGPFDYVKEEF